MTLTQLTAHITKLLISKYPVRWTVAELVLVTGADKRRVFRALAILRSVGLAVTSGGSYSLPMQVVEQFYGAKWYLKQETDKALFLHSLESKETKPQKKEDKNA